MTTRTPGARFRGIPAALLDALGGAAADPEDLGQPWSRMHTVAVTPEAGPHAGRRLVLQWGGDRQAMARRLRIAGRLPAIAPALPLPGLLGGDADADPPFVITAFVPGASGRTMLASDAGAARLGAVAGTVLAAIRQVPTTGLGLGTTWADGSRTAAAARRRLAAATPLLRQRDVGALRAIADELEARPAGAPVLAHGDLAPVNLVVRDGAVVALLDPERARIAGALFDAAWWCWILAVHHPDRARAANGAFLASAGIAGDADTVRRLRSLAALQCLEMLAATRRGRADRRRAWVERLEAVLDLPWAEVVQP